MAFTVRNLKELEDTAGEYAPGLEARFGRRHIDSEHLGVTYLRYAPGYRLPLGHRHREQEEVYVVVSGSGWIRLGDEVLPVRRWDAIRVAPPLVRSFEAGPDGLEVIAVGSDRPEGGDGVMTHDWWTSALEAGAAGS